jgi:prepilin-type N-terminal cleavage/methylation domain-containing protein
MKTTHKLTPEGFLARSGFTLMEVALAIVVVAIGMMAAFALITTGLDSSAKAVAMTRGAIFADDVFNGLRSKASLATDAGEGAWELFWEDFEDGAAAVTVAAGPMWQLDVEVIPGWPPVIVTNYIYVVATPEGDPAEGLSLTNYCYRTDTTNIPNSSLRYTLYVEPHVETITVGTPPEEFSWSRTNKITAILNVWEGQYGTPNINRAMTFVSEFENAGGL